MRHHHTSLEDFLAIIMVVTSICVLHKIAMFLFNKMKGNL